MYTLSKGWNSIAAFGHGMILTMALIGALRIIGWFRGFEVSQQLSGNIFLIGSLLLGPLFVWLYRRTLKADASPIAGR